MQKKIEIDDESKIVLKERTEINPLEVNLDYLVNDLEFVTPIIKHDYDINIFSLDLSSLDFVGVPLS
jgi:hypothetical protein